VRSRPARVAALRELISAAFAQMRMPPLSFQTEEKNMTIINELKVEAFDLSQFLTLEQVVARICAGAPISWIIVHDIESDSIVEMAVDCRAMQHVCR
jgi:hypothetical protein